MACARVHTSTHAGSICRGANNAPETVTSQNSILFLRLEVQDQASAGLVSPPVFSWACRWCLALCPHGLLLHVSVARLLLLIRTTVMWD